LNHYSPFTLNLEKAFFAPRPKIFLQQYRPGAEICSLWWLRTRLPRHEPQ
jgi:hypothetical protein